MNENRFVKALRYFVLGLGAFAILSPIYILLTASFKNAEEFGRSSPVAFPQNLLYIENFRQVFEKGNLGLAYTNIGMITIMTIFVNVIIGTMAAYAIQRFEFKFKKIIIGAYTLALIIPGITTQVATYQVVKYLGLTNTIFAMVVLHLGTDIIQLYVYMQYLNHIPRELDEAASVEGASYIRIYCAIIMPLLIPAIVTLTVIKIIGIYNDMFTPYLYMSSPRLAVVSTALMKFSRGISSQWNTLSAGILLVMSPIVLLYLFLQKYIMAGIVDGAVKA